MKVWCPDTHNVLVEVYPVESDEEVAQLFSDINKAEVHVCFCSYVPYLKHAERVPPTLFYPSSLRAFSTVGQ
jgi:hypothetical protein